MTEAWDEEADVVVLGAGAGGLCAAIVAATEGLRVIVIEKTGLIGGSAAVSGGGIWVPMNPLMPQSDSLEQVRAYLRSTIGRDLADSPLMAAYLENGPRMVDYLQRHTEVKLLASSYSPDYYPEAEGGSTARALYPVELDARALGEDFARLRPPMPEYMLFGGMMVDRYDIAHLLRARRSPASFLHAARLLLRHLRDRLTYPRGTRLVLGNALAARLLLSASNLGIPIHLSTPARELVLDNHQVTGVMAGARRVRARRGVVIATGGFPGNPELRARHLPHADRHWTVAPADNVGEGIALAEKAGARVASHNAHNGFWTPVSLHQRKDGRTAVFPHLITERAKPGLIAVDAGGKRFVDESCSYHDFVNAMHARSVIPAFLIFDRRALQRYGVGHARPWPFPKGELIRSGYLVKASSLAELAQALRIEPAALERTVERYNGYARRGEDPDFGKGSSAYGRYLGDPDQKPNPCLAPIENAPFYAVRLYPGSIGTSRGLITNESAVVLDRDGRPIEGLYACGNDMNSIMGGHYPGPGITLGPALTFGYIAAMHMAHRRRPTEEEVADAVCNAHPG